MSEHVVTVRPLRIPRPSRKVTYDVWCSVCGQIGWEWDFWMIASAAAEDHMAAEGSGPTVTHEVGPAHADDLHPTEGTVGVPDR